MLELPGISNIHEITINRIPIINSKITILVDQEKPFLMASNIRKTISIKNNNQ